MLTRASGSQFGHPHRRDIYRVVKWNKPHPMQAEQRLKRLVDENKEPHQIANRSHQDTDLRIPLFGESA